MPTDGMEDKAGNLMAYDVNEQGYEIDGMIKMVTLMVLGT